MSVAIESLSAGDTLFCVTRRNRVGDHQGRLRVRTVQVHAVDLCTGVVLASRNGAPAREWPARNGRMSWQRGNPLGAVEQKDAQMEAWLSGAIG